MDRRAALLIGVVAACHSAQTSRPAGDDGLDGATSGDAVATGDAAADAYVYPGSDAGTPGIVSCYAEGNPTATCTLPAHCCFANYSAQHNGSCSSSTCAWGTIDCDGPEDCSAGQRCCSHAITDTDNVTIGYRMSCQQDVCGATPGSEELCHPTSSSTGTCSSGTCVNVLGANNDLPRTLYICR
ncbi:MAG TPA: hypothetical protein VIV40_25190 [Kofleriaceae bacterium]